MQEFHEHRYSSIFRIANTIVQVPLGANYLFVAAHDIYYSDNSDPDGDYGVRITPLASVHSGTLDIAPLHSRFDGLLPFLTNQAAQRLDTSTRLVDLG
jgi:hypothetical protein